MKLSFALALVPLTLSCGGDDGGPHHIVGTDAPMVDAPEACKAQMTYAPTFGSDNQFIEDVPATGSGADATIHEMFYEGDLDANNPGDIMFLDLYQSYGAFTGSGTPGDDDIKTGQYTISGDETNYSTCGVCVTIAAQAKTDTAAQTFTVDDWYMATGGIVTLTSISGRFTGTLQNIGFRRVVTTADGGPGDDPQAGPGGDCTSHITSVSFDLPIPVGSGSARIAIPVSKLSFGRPESKLSHRHY